MLFLMLGTAAVIGFVLGLRFRVGAVIPIAGAMVLVGMLVGVLTDWPLRNTMASGLLLLIFLESAYAIGLFVSSTWLRRPDNDKNGPSPGA